MAPFSGSCHFPRISIRRIVTANFKKGVLIIKMHRIFLPQGAFSHFFNPRNSAITTVEKALRPCLKQKFTVFG